VKTATFPAVIEAKKIAMKQLEYYQTMMAGAQAPAEGVLLPCPCCGSDANFHQVEVKENADYGGQYIECECCGLSTNMRFAWGDDPKPLLAEAWNRRSTPAEGALTDDDMTTLVLCAEAFERIASKIAQTSDDRLFAQTRPRRMTINDAAVLADRMAPALRKLHAKLYAGQAPAEGVLTLDQALRRAFILGQTYWQQADSDSYSQNRKSDETRQKFEALVSSILSTPAGQAPAPAQEPEACQHDWRDFYAGPTRTHLICAKCEKTVTNPQPAQEPQGVNK
jgi:hypothetical protein